MCPRSGYGQYGILAPPPSKSPVATARRVPLSCSLGAALNHEDRSVHHSFPRQYCCTVLHFVCEFGEPWPKQVPSARLSAMAKALLTYCYSEPYVVDEEVRRDLTSSRMQKLSSTCRFFLHYYLHDIVYRGDYVKFLTRIPT